MNLYWIAVPGTKSTVTIQIGLLNVHSLADIAIAPPLSGVGDQLPSAGMEPVRSIVSPNVVSSRTVKVIATLERVQVPEVEVLVGVEGVVVVGGIEPPVTEVQIGDPVS